MAIKPLDEQKSQNCNPPGSSTSNLFIEEEKIACDNSKKLSFQETQIMKEAALEIQNVESPSFSYSSVSALGSTLKGDKLNFQNESSLRLLKIHFTLYRHLN